MPGLDDHSSRLDDRSTQTTAYAARGPLLAHSRPMQLDLWNVVLWIHLLAMAFFVGGQLFLVAAVVPVLRHDPDKTRVRAIARRFGWGSLVAVGVALLSGSLMASHNHLWGDATLHAKLGLVALAGVLVAAHTRRPGDHRLEGLIFLDSLAIVLLATTL